MLYQDQSIYNMNKPMKLMLTRIMKMNLIALLKPRNKMHRHLHKCRVALMRILVALALGFMLTGGAYADRAAYQLCCLHALLSINQSLCDKLLAISHCKIFVCVLDSNL